MYKVLLVEDEDVIRKGFMFLVDWRSVDCVVVGEAVDGEDGLQKIRENTPDIVIVDITMPVKNGLEMLQDSIAEYKYHAIIVSGYSEFEYAQKAISLGVTEYLLKPVDFNVLYDAIRKITGRIKSHTKVEDYIKQMELKKREQDILQAEPENFANFKNKYVIDMVHYIEEHYKHRISLTDLSETYGISCTYLNSKFKTETSYTFNDFLNRYRIQKAVELLRENKFKVYEIADQVGFSDYKYFIKVFKKYAGASPVKFMEPTELENGGINHC